MGIKLNGLITTRPIQREDLDGQRVAIDVPNLAYPPYATRMLAGANREDALRFMWRHVAQRIFDLAELGARSVLVFDGKPHPLKASVLEERAAARKYPPLQADDYRALRHLASSLGVPTVDAPYESEAQAAWMDENERVDIVATTDWDALAMGATRLLRGLSNASPTRGGSWDLVTDGVAFRDLGINSREALALAAVLMGCDYSAGIAGVGPKKALKIAREATFLDRTLPGTGVDLAVIDNWQAAYLAIARPDVDEIFTPTWSRPDRDAALRVLGDLGFPQDQAPAALARLSIIHQPREVTA